MAEQGISDLHVNEHPLPDADVLATLRLSRRSLLMRAGGAAVGLGLPAALARAAAAANRPRAASLLTPVSLQLDYIKNVQFAGMLWGLEKGFYRDEGIALNMTAQGATTDPVTLVAAGKSTIGMESGDELILARAKKIPIKTFAADIQTNPIGFTTLASSGIKTLPEIRGHTVGFPPSYANEIPLVLSLAGLKPSQVKLRTTGFDPTSALIDHQIDAADSFLTNTPITLNQMGIKTNFILWANYGYSYYTDCFFVTDQTLAKQSSMLKAFVRATQRSWADVFAQPQTVTKFVVEKYGAGALTTKQQLAELIAFKPLMVTNYTKKYGFGAMAPARWKQGIDLFVKFKLIPKAIPVSDLFVDGYVKP